jgi:hypothetical protein
MKIMKVIMGSMCLAVSCTSAAWVEYQLVKGLGGVISAFALTSMSAAIVVALLRAPEGCESADGFHARSRHYDPDGVRHARRKRPAKTEMARFLMVRPSRAHN